MGIEEIFTNYIKNMEDDRQSINYFGTFYSNLESLYGKPMTSKQFIKKYNFNNPSIEDYWEKEAEKTIKEAIGNLKNEESIFGDFKIKQCYL